MEIGTGIYLEKLKHHPGFYQSQYTCLEIQDFVMPNNLDIHFDSLIHQYATILKNYEGFLTLHGPYIDLHPTSFDPLVREVCSRRYRQTLAAAQALNAKFVVVHSDYDPTKNYAEYESYLLEQSILFWKDILKEFENAKVTAVIENVHNKSPHLIKNIIEGVNSPYLGACLDTGHVHALGKSKLHLWVEDYGQHLRYIHLHDNNGDRDQHLPLGEGTIDFSSFFQKLKEISYDGPIICEIFSEPDVQRSNLRRIDEYLKGLTVD